VEPGNPGWRKQPGVNFILFPLALTMRLLQPNLIFVGKIRAPYYKTFTIVNYASVCSLTYDGNRVFIALATFITIIKYL